MWQRLVGLGFRLLYRELAWSYDLVAWLVSRGRWRTWGETALNHVRGERVLELGHGPGHLQVALARRGFKPVGLDVSPQMSRLARRRLERVCLPRNLVRGRGQHLPFPSGDFDSLVATFPTAYIVDPATLSEVSRVLRPGGRLVVVLGARLTGQDPLTRFIEWLYRITGQRETEQASDMDPVFRDAGLAPTAVQVEIEESEVYLLVCERVARPPAEVPPIPSSGV